MMRVRVPVDPGTRYRIVNTHNISYTVLVLILYNYSLNRCQVKIFDFIDPVNRVRKGELGKIGGTFSPTQVSRQVRLWRRQAPLTSMGKKNSPPFFVGLTIRNPISKS